jgi:hypothetical protein
VAVSRNVVETAQSISTGGTAQLRPPVVPAGARLIDVRLLQYENLNGSDATRVLPAGYTPGGVGDSYFAGDGTGDTTNLRPGQYWFRIEAVAANAQNFNSDLSARIGPFTVSMGPDEVRGLIEAWVAAYLAANPGADYAQITAAMRGSQSTLRLVDVRGAAEIGDEGYPRFFTDRFTIAATEAGNATNLPRKDATILVL